METKLYVVRFAGPFGFIKPWTAVRDSETHSQQFLTPSIVEGMRQKLEVSQILRHRLRYRGLSRQQEQTQIRGMETNKLGWTRKRSILVRHVMLQPSLFLAFPTVEEASKASEQHLCLCRNEDVVYPFSSPVPMTGDEFDAIVGIELLFMDGPGSFPVGFNRFAGGQEMRGILRIVGDPAGLDGDE